MHLFLLLKGVKFIRVLLRHSLVIFLQFKDLLSLEEKWLVDPNSSASRILTLRLMSP